MSRSRKLIEFDKNFNNLKDRNKIPVLSGSPSLQWNHTRHYFRFKHDTYGRTYLKEAEDEDVDYHTTFAAIYVIKKERLFIRRSSIFDAIRGRRDSIKQQKRTYRFLRNYPPTNQAAIMIGGGHPPYLDWEVLKDKMVQYKPATITEIYFLRLNRIKAIIQEVEKTVMIRNEMSKLKFSVFKKMQCQHLNEGQYKLN